MIPKNDLSKLTKKDLSDLIDFILSGNDPEDLALMYLENCRPEVLERTVKDLSDARAAGIF